VKTQPFVSSARLRPLLDSLGVTVVVRTNSVAFHPFSRSIPPDRSEFASPRIELLKTGRRRNDAAADAS
jgi:hypothetical protein